MGYCCANMRTPGRATEPRGMRCRPHHRRASSSSDADYSINSGSSVNQNGTTSTLLVLSRAQESPTTLLGRIDAIGPSLLGPSVSSSLVRNRSSVLHGRTMSSSMRSSFLLVLVTLLNMSSLTVGLVIEKPFQLNFEHV